MVSTTSLSRTLNYGMGDLVHSLSMAKTAALSPYKEVPIVPRVEAWALLIPIKLGAKGRQVPLG
jgi:hypothetical protein